MRLPAAEAKRPATKRRLRRLTSLSGVGRALTPAFRARGNLPALTADSPPQRGGCLGGPHPRGALPHGPRRPSHDLWWLTAIKCGQGWNVGRQRRPLRATSTPRHNIVPLISIGGQLGALPLVTSWGKRSKATCCIPEFLAFSHPRGRPLELFISYRWIFLFPAREFPEFPARRHWLPRVHISDTIRQCGDAALHRFDWFIAGLWPVINSHRELGERKGKFGNRTPPFNCMQMRGPFCLLHFQSERIWVTFPDNFFLFTRF